jgi:6-phosphogluconolactonase (cycloisomerase 2 family)
MKLNSALIGTIRHRDDDDDRLVICDKEFSSTAKDCFIGLSHLKRLCLSGNYNFKTVQSKASIQVNVS